MQDIVFYVAAKETLGKVRDYSNMRNSDAPLLTLGVAVCLRIRLFDDIEVSTPYPIASFNGITDWQWRMDADFDRSTTCKLVADADGISVHTVTDTVNGETMSFTEFVIPISNMNTEELAAWLGSDKFKTGLAGELVGYDNEGHAAFVLQIEDFSVRNRLAGLNDGDEEYPTPVDQEIVTRPVAEQMIQTAVSAFDAAKQDKLTSGNAGTGITISSAGVISTENVPQSAVTGLTAELSYKQNALSTGFWIEIDDDWISVERYHTIHGPYSRGSVTLLAGEAYRIYATNAVVTLNKGSMPDNTWGIEGLIEIFVANTGYIRTGNGVVLANALEPDAVNNCTVRFHDGLAIISVEDHVAGYIVTVNAASGAGSLNYGLTTASNEYISFDATLNGETFDLGGVTTSAGEKHVVGNGYMETIVSGGINCTSKTTFSNLSMNGVVVSSGTLTLGDVYIPNGTTVSVSGGGLAVENVTGDGGTVDLGGTNVPVPDFSTVHVSGIVFSSGYANPYGGVFNVGSGANVTATNCIFAENSASFRGGVAYTAASASLVFSGCSFSSNGGSICLFGSGATCRIVDCEFDSGELLRSYGNSPTIYSFAGSNVFPGQMLNEANYTLIVSSGAVIDLTGNTNAAPIAPSGGVMFAGGAATILYGTEGDTSSCFIGGATVAALGNDGSVQYTSSLRGFYGSSITFGGVTIKAPSAMFTYVNTGAPTSFHNCVMEAVCLMTDTGGTHQGSIMISGNLTCTYSNANQFTNFGGTSVFGGTVSIADNAAITHTNLNSGSLMLRIGTLVVGDGVTVNGNTVSAGTYTSATLDLDGTITEA